MRSKNAVKNILFSLISAFLSLTLTLINRKVLLIYLGSEMLGYESLFTNVFSILSLSEMGASTVIAYKLYKSITIQDINETNILVSMYKYLYRVIGLLVALLGIIFFFFLQYIITAYTSPWNFIQKIYLIQLASTVASYFLTYKRMLFIANQQEYIITKTDIILNFITQILKILAIILWRNYIIYLIISVSKIIILNAIIQIKAGLSYPQYKHVQITINDFIKRNIFKDMINFMAQKISSMLYYNTDNIFISMLLGVSTVGLYSNYYTIKTQIFRLTVRLFNPLQASIGNFINDHDKDPKKALELFELLDMISYTFALIFSACMFNIFQPFISLWYGEQYLLDNSIVILIVINTYIETLREIPYYFRSAFGQYEVDKKYVTFGAIANISLTVILGRILGLSGVLIGTVVGMFFLWHGVIQFLYKIYFKTCIADYYYKHFKLSLLSIAVVLVTNKICLFIPTSISGIIVKGFISSSISLIVVFIKFNKTTAFKQLHNYSLQFIKRKK